MSELRHFWEQIVPFTYTLAWYERPGRVGSSVHGGRVLSRPLIRRAFEPERQASGGSPFHGVNVVTQVEYPQQPYSYRFLICRANVAPRAMFKGTCSSEFLLACRLSDLLAREIREPTPAPHGRPPPIPGLCHYSCPCQIRDNTITLPATRAESMALGRISGVSTRSCLQMMDTAQGCWREDLPDFIGVSSPPEFCASSIH